MFGWHLVISGKIYNHWIYIKEYIIIISHKLIIRKHSDNDDQTFMV